MPITTASISGRCDIKKKIKLSSLIKLNNLDALELIKKKNYFAVEHIVLQKHKRGLEYLFSVTDGLP